jgi:hypothetical protein
MAAARINLKAAFFSVAESTPWTSEFSTKFLITKFLIAARAEGSALVANCANGLVNRFILVLIQVDWNYPFLEAAFRPHLFLYTYCGPKTNVSSHS